jgi:hypothetical protein
LSAIERDAIIEFVHPCGLSNTFFWPSQKDLCWVPFENIIKEVRVPASTSISGRTYFIEKKFKALLLKNLRTLCQGRSDLFKW